jgi:hypothetical protein
MLLLLALVGCFEAAIAPAAARPVDDALKVDTGSDPVPDTGS